MLQNDSPNFLTIKHVRAVAFLILLASVLPCPASAEDWQSFPLRENGSIPVWTVAGPFPNASPYKHGPGCFGFFQDFLEGAGGEASAEPAAGDQVAFGEGKSVAWDIAFSNAAGLLDYIGIFRSDRLTPGVAYAYCRIVSPAAQAAVAKVRSNDGVRVWFNGALVHEFHAGRGVDEGEADRVPLDLREGPNTLLVKVDQSAGGWGQIVTLENPDGSPLPGVRAEVRTRKPLAGKFWSAEIASTDLVAKSPEGPRQMLLAKIISGGLENVTCRIALPEWPVPEEIALDALPPGEHRLELLVPPLAEPGEAQITLVAASDRLELPPTALAPPREWTIDLVQHTHTDVGYTRPQDELMPDFLRHIDHALDYCDLTDDYPEEAKFRWTCEASWSVREFLRRRPPEQIERLRKRVAEGRIEVTGLFLNMLEATDESLMAASLEPVREIRAAGLTVTTAMQDDVPGAAWCLTDFLPDIGIKYLVMGVNNDLTPRPFFRPTAFWWESPSGKRLLAWRPDHYHTANNLRIHQGDLGVFKERLLDYLNGIAAQGYPFERVAMQYSGLQIDNSPPALTGCDMIRRWNEAFEWPRLRSATAGEFPAWVEANHADDIEAIRGAWPNWWTNGHAFANFETAESRRTQADFGATQGLLATASLLGEALPERVKDDVRKIQDDLLFFGEHTFGAQENFTHPNAENTAVQWGEKTAHLWDAVKDSALLRETAWGLLEKHVTKAEVPVVAVFNTLPWPRSGVLDLYIGHELLPQGQPARFVDTETGKAMPALLMRSRFEGSYWKIRVEDVPAMGAKTLRIESGDATPAVAPTELANTLENHWYRITVDPDTGALVSLIDKDTGRELIDTGATWGFGQLLFDQLTDVHFSSHASYLERAARSTVRDVSIAAPVASPLWQSLRISARADSLNESANSPGLTCDVRLYTHEKRLELQYTIQKRFDPAPNALYVAFPFAKGTFTYEAQGGLVTPGVNQIPGSSTDWHTLQGFLALRGDNGQVLLSSNDTPLVQFGEINMGKWQYVAEVKKPHAYSWVLNDYWTAPFRGLRESEFTWNYSLTSSAESSNTEATRFGAETRTPFAARVFPPKANDARAGSDASPVNSGGKANLSIAPSGLHAVNIRPAADGNGLILHVREVEGETATLRLEGLPWPAHRIDVVNALEETFAENAGEVVFAPFEVKFIRVWPQSLSPAS